MIFDVFIGFLCIRNLILTLTYTDTQIKIYRNFIIYLLFALKTFISQIILSTKILKNIQGVQFEKVLNF